MNNKWLELLEARQALLEPTPVQVAEQTLRLHVLCAFEQTPREDQTIH
jgi:hypothetical protein